MGLLYITADSIGEETGGGLVSAQELLALREFAGENLVQKKDFAYASVDVLSRANLGSQRAEPWKWDEVACCKRDWFVNPPKLCHIYSGTFSKTVEGLKRNGCKVVYTIAAHDVAISKREHEALGMPFNLPHLTEKEQWKRYSEGYRLADVIVCPGSVPREVVRNYGGDFLQKDIRIIPHGCHMPAEVKPLPKTFVVGYGGSCTGADKGVRYLLEAWKKLAYTDGSLLVLAGKDSTSQMCKHLLNTHGGGSVHLAGWQKNMSDFYNFISVFVCPAATEGFNLEALEACSYGRPVICSTGAGAQDLIPELWRVSACDVDNLMDAIKCMKDLCSSGTQPSIQFQQDIARKFTWDKVRNMYKALWTEVLSK